MNKALASTNFNYCEATIKLKRDLELSYLELAQRLYKIREQKMFEPNYETFDEFLQEIKISTSTASNLIGIWVRFVLQFKIKPKLLAEAGGWSVVAEILPHAENKQQAEKWLLQAKENSRQDLRKSLKEHVTGIDMSLCKHEDKEIITFERCKKCGHSERLYEDKSQT